MIAPIEMSGRSNEILTAQSTTDCVLGNKFRPVGQNLYSEKMAGLKVVQLTLPFNPTVELLIVGFPCEIGAGKRYRRVPGLLRLGVIAPEEQRLLALTRRLAESKYERKCQRCAFGVSETCCADEENDEGACAD